MAERALGVAFGEYGREGDGSSVSTKRNSADPRGMREGGLAPNSDSHDTTGVDGPGLVKEGRDKDSHIFHPPPGDGRNRVYGGGSVPNGGSSPTNWDYDGIGDDSPGVASRVRGEACRGRTPHVNAALSGESSEKQGQSANRMLSSPSSRRVGNARPP